MTLLDKIKKFILCIEDEEEDRGDNIQLPLLYMIGSGNYQKANDYIKEKCSSYCFHPEFQNYFSYSGLTGDQVSDIIAELKKLGFDLK